MSISSLFKDIGAPLRNIRWSWGGVRSDGAVILRIWQNEIDPRGGRRWAQLTHHQAFLGREKNLGYRERNRHVDLVKAGASCYLIICEARDVTKVPRVIKSFNGCELFVTGDHAEYQGNTWIEITGCESIQGQ